MRYWSRLLIWMTLLGVLVFASGRVYADALGEYEKARNSYTAGRYQEAEERFAQLNSSGVVNELPSAKMREQARVYHVACLLALGRTAEADREIESLIRKFPELSPDPVLFPSVVSDHFSDIRAKLREELEREARKRAEAEKKRRMEAALKRKKELERLKMLAKLASEETVEHRNSRWLAAVPFGVGQFQNGQDALGWTFLTSEVALTVGTVLTSGIYQALESKANEPNVDRAELNSRLREMKLYNNIMFGVLMGTVVGGIVHAEVTYVPYRRRVRQRRLPKELRQVVPDIDVQQGGVVLGVRGTF